MAPVPNTGVDKILQAHTSASAAPNREVFALFSLSGRIAVVTGANQGIGLEVASAYAEAGAVVYCLDISPTPSEDFKVVDAYLNALPALPQDGSLSPQVLKTSTADASTGTAREELRKERGRLVYVKADVTNQMEMWDRLEKIAEIEGRVDVCVANAGILRSFSCLDYPEQEWKNIMDVNVNGVLYTAQAAARQMKRLGIPGSIILTASMSGSITNQGQQWTGYNTSKSAVIQMGRSLACELGKDGIRVNTVSPGYIYSKMTKQFLDSQPGLKENWAAQNPLGRIGRTQELRGPYLWLASDGSTFCTGSDIIVDGGHRAW
ncbi:hypothetical protein D9611_007250 [Ephemerocybe angulata]|uniref:NAD(P)-binding protein n=1 Tax=Ephemerocybe angulata TaxID=980116 RepID=A0A8H5EW28_9AGAR|nr:hypothetical protein D9611_007250 [Tulosesus angulatus]